ncbi:hypothetical protein PRIC2_003637 [Phytophthora ramorum]
MGGSDSKLSAQAQTQQEEQYAIQMKSPVVAAAMEALEIDKPTTGLKFYQLFAAMDTDGSKSIDLEEFHRFFELRHTAFSDLVFSNLGKQTPARGVAFDVSTKRRDEAKSALEELWEQEQSSLITERHEAVTNLVKSISTRTLHKQTGKKSADKVVRSYTQKKLITEENVIRGRFSERWQMLERAAELRAQRDLETSRKSAKTDSKTTLH